ncbi:MAG TPA: homoserine kinase [Blastocatellia bacterium]|nr:homoserine kinase [Blastocatellia bacterium]
MAVIRVPATAANLGPGFDCHGLALSLYLTVEVEPSEEPFGTFTFRGEGAQELGGAAEENLIFQAMRFAAEREGVPLQPARLRVTNEIPLARGLGSSAAAIVAGLSAFEAVTGARLPEGKLLAYATAIEGHSDNVAAALLGSFVVSCTGDGGEVLAARVAWPDDVRAVVVIPEFKVRTEQARAVVPGTVSRADAVYNLQRAALTVAALAGGRFELLREAMRDRLHQPHRAALVPGLEDVLQIEADGLLGIALSGSGPTVIALASHNFDGIAAAISERFAARDIRCRSLSLEVDEQGREIME